MGEEEDGGGREDGGWFSYLSMSHSDLACRMVKILCAIFLASSCTTKIITLKINCMSIFTENYRTFDTNISAKSKRLTSDTFLKKTKFKIS